VYELNDADIANQLDDLPADALAVYADDA